MKIWFSAGHFIGVITKFDGIAEYKTYALQGANTNRQKSQDTSVNIEPRKFFSVAQKASPEKTFLSIMLKASKIPVTNIKPFLMSSITKGKLKLLAVINFKRKVLKFNPLQSQINLSYIHRLFQS